ncbi:Uncharacterised protein [Mycobacteroides abscessus]|nr:Uncharacterised protein [Mycobacteroides abscessus]
MPHRDGVLDPVDAAVRPQVRPAHARGLDAHDRVGRREQARVVALLHADVVRGVDDGRAHGGSSGWAGGGRDVVEPTATGGAGPVRPSRACGQPSSVRSVWTACSSS